MKSIIVAASVSAIVPSALLADDGPWTDREVCRAATKTYFFLDSKPTDAPDEGGRFGFRSAAGNVYTCQIEGTIAAFYWVNKSGEDMSSKSTIFSIDGNLLHVNTDMLDEDFSSE